MANRTLDVDKTTVLLDNLVCNKEPKPCTPSFGGEEGVKDLFFVFGGDAFPCVLDFNRTVLSSVWSAPQCGCYRHDATIIGCLECIQPKIHEDLLDLLWVNCNGRQC